MSLTVVLFVFACTFFILFSDDFLKLGKKLLDIRGMRLTLPLLIASTLIIDFFDFFQKDVFILINGYAQILSGLAAFLPAAKWAVPLVGFILFMLVALIPEPLINYIRAKLNKAPFAYSKQFSVILWLLSVVFYTMLTAG